MKEKQVGKQSVALLDNLDKAKECGMDDPKALLEIENERKLQGYAKGNMLGQAKLDDEVIEGVKKEWPKCFRSRLFRWFVRFKEA